MNISPDYQWLLAFASPLVREILTWASFQINYKVVGKHEKMSIKLPILHYMATKYAIFLSIIVAGTANSVTNYCILAIDFAEHVYNVMKIIRKYRNNNMVESNFFHT